MMDCLPDVLAKEARMAGLHARDENAVVVLQQTPGNLQNLLRRFAGTENDLWKALPEGPVCVHLRESEVGHRGGLEALQNLFAADATRAEFFEQSDCFRCCHPLRMRERRRKSKCVLSGA